MIAADTNVLVRLTVADDEGQGKRAAKLFARTAQVLVAKTVVLETAWVLQSAYGFRAMTWPERSAAWPACRPSVVLEDAITSASQRSRSGVVT